MKRNIKQEKSKVITDITDAKSKVNKFNNRYIVRKDYFAICIASQSTRDFLI